MLIEYRRSGSILFLTAGGVKYAATFHPGDPTATQRAVEKALAGNSKIEISELLTRIANEYDKSKQTIVEESGDVDALRVEGAGGNYFIAKNSNGIAASQSGFFLNQGEDWIVTELTHLHGEKMEEDGEKVNGIEAVLVCNHVGQRSVKLLNGATFEIDGKVVDVEVKSLGRSGLETCMNFAAVKRFLGGETVTIAELLPEAEKTIRKFVSFHWDDRLYIVVACITIASYFFDVFQAFPITIFYGISDTGKTRAVKTLIYLGHRGFLIVSPREAAIFRSIEAWRPFLGVDEFTKLYEELLQVVRSIYKKGERVPRVEKGKHDAWFLRLFETYAPFCMGTTEMPESMLVTRCIFIIQRKAADPNPAKKDPEPGDFEEFRSRGYIARLTQANLVYETAEELDKTSLGLDGREWEIWRPVLTIAKMVGDEVYAQVLEYAKNAYAEKCKNLYDEIKTIIEAVWRLAHSTSENFPLSFTPKDVSSQVWEMLKDNYKVVKTSRTDPQAGTVEEYDYNTRAFGEVWNPEKIGKNFLSKFGLKSKRISKGTEYHFLSFDEFQNFAERYHPTFKDNESTYRAAYNGQQRLT